MAYETGQPLLSLKQELLTKGHEYSFLQAMRLLRLLGASPELPNDPADHNSTIPIRIRPNLSLAFPPADITSIEEQQGEEPAFLITANFLGLYGHSSPLPTFYTEELIDEASLDESVSRDFLDIYNHRLFTLYYLCCLKYNLFFKIIDENSKDVTEKLFCLLGIGKPELREEFEFAFQLCRYIGLITQYSHSALGLEILLRDAFGGVPVGIIECVKTTEKIPAQLHAMLGRANSRLGMDSTIGSEALDRTGKILIQMGPIGLDKFNSLLPGKPGYRKLAVLTDFFVHDRIIYDVELILAKDECRPARLGSPQMSRLGLDTWVFSSETIGEVSAVFPLS
jgi:type VI secretion system protein ImpH